MWWAGVGGTLRYRGAGLRLALAALAHYIFRFANARARLHPQAWMGVGRMTGMIIGAAVGGILGDQDTRYRTCLLFLGCSILGKQGIWGGAPHAERRAPPSPRGSVSC